MAGLLKMPPPAWERLGYTKPGSGPYVADENGTMVTPVGMPVLPNGQLSDWGSRARLELAPFEYQGALTERRMDGDNGWVGGDPVDQADFERAKAAYEADPIYFLHRRPEGNDKYDYERAQYKLDPQTGELVRATDWEAYTDTPSSDAYKDMAKFIAIAAAAYGGAGLLGAPTAAGQAAVGGAMGGEAFAGMGAGLGGSGAAAAAEAAAAMEAASAADIAGGLVPEFGSSAAYDGFMQQAIANGAVGAAPALGAEAASGVGTLPANAVPPISPASAPLPAPPGTVELAGAAPAVPKLAGGGSSVLGTLGDTVKSAGGKLFDSGGFLSNLFGGGMSDILKLIGAGVSGAMVERQAEKQREFLREEREAGWKREDDKEAAALARRAPVTGLLGPKVRVIKGGGR